MYKRTWLVLVVLTDTMAWHGHESLACVYDLYIYVILVIHSSYSDIHEYIKGCRGDLGQAGTMECLLGS